MSQLQQFPACEPVYAGLDWHCGPVGQTRDSTALERANFDAAIEALEEADPEGTTFEVIRFAHWACGWVEEIFTDPNSEAHTVASDLRRRLAEHPVLDDERFAQYEAMETEESCLIQALEKEMADAHQIAPPSIDPPAMGPNARVAEVA